MLVDAAWAGIIQAIDLVPGYVRVAVDRATWSEISFRLKMGLVWAVACFAIDADSRVTVRVKVFDNVENKLVGEFDGVEFKVPSDRKGLRGKEGNPTLMHRRPTNSRHHRCGAHLA